MMLLVFVMVGFVCAVGDWEDIDTGDASDVVEDMGGDRELNIESISGKGTGEVYNEGEAEFYTANFYIALGVFCFALVVIGIVVWLLIRGPKNKWDK